MEKDIQIRSTYVEMTPELAQKYLDTQVLNRKLDYDWAVALAQSMEKGEWILDGNSIKMDDNGHLIDGQHRLHAVILSGMTVKMEVKSGFPSEAINVIDTFMKPRSMSNILTIRGIKNSSTVGAGIRAYELETRGVLNGNVRYRVTPTTALDIYNSSPDVWQRCAYLAKSCSHQSKGHLLLLKSPMVCGYAGYLILKKGYSFDKVEYFFNQLCSSRESANIPIEKLRTVLLRNIAANKKYPQIAIRNMIVKAWNAYVTGRALKGFRYTVGEERAEFI